MNIAFFWTWDFSKNILSDIFENFPQAKVSLVVSQPDKPVWRKKIITQTPVKEYATSKGLSVLQPEKLRNNTAFFDQLKQWTFDFIVVVAYWKIVPIEVLEASKYWCINVHGSILPKYRWASPIQEAIKNWDKKTGVTIMYMSEQMDTGDILSTQEVDIKRQTNTIDIFNEFSKISARLLIDTLEQILENKIIWKKQDDSIATYCSKIEKTDGEINWEDSSQNIFNKFKAYTPWPWIYSHYKSKKISIQSCDYTDDGILSDNDFHPWDVVEYSHQEKEHIWVLCWEGILLLNEIKLEWKSSMDIFSFINGNQDFLDYNFIK